jgi:hypothetical protein
VHAVGRRYPDAVFFLESAAALRGLPVFLEPTHIHLLLPPSATSRELNGIRMHTTRQLPMLEEVGGFLLPTPPEIALDIARSRHNGIGLAVANAVLRADSRITGDTLAQLNAERVSSRGRRHARWVLARATPVPESPLESISLAAIEWLGFPEPELQKWILGPSGTDDDRVDFWWEAFSVAGEADGLLKYDADSQRAREALRARSVRDARLLARGASATAHWGWYEVRALLPLRAALVAAGLRPEHPEDSLQTRSLRRALTTHPAKQQPRTETAAST